MGTTLIVTAGPVNAPGANRGKPRKVFRGIVRTMIRKTLARLNSLRNSDFRAYDRALMHNYDAALVMGSVNSADYRAFTRVMDRLKACLDMKEGD